MLLQEIDSSQVTDKDVPLAQYQVDVRCFGLFIALQLYSQSAKMSSSQNFEKDPWGMKEG